jgi:hypothetical protein
LQSCLFLVHQIAWIAYACFEWVDSLKRSQFSGIMETKICASKRKLYEYHCILQFHGVNCMSTNRLAWGPNDWTHQQDMSELHMPLRSFISVSFHHLLFHCNCKSLRLAFSTTQMCLLTSYKQLVRIKISVHLLYLYFALNSAISLTVSPSFH